MASLMQILPIFGIQSTVSMQQLALPVEARYQAAAYHRTRMSV
jgi:hypothetical protein